MGETTPESIAGVPATMLTTVSARALAHLDRPDMGFRDPDAERLVQSLGIDPREYCRYALSLVSTIYRSVFLDRMTRRFFERHPGGVCLNLACGLGTSYERIAKSARSEVTWFDVDLPEVVAIRRRFFADTEHRKTVEGDLTEPSLLARLFAAAGGRPIIVLMEGVLYYLDPEEVRAVFERVAAAHDAVGGEVELGFDVVSSTGLQGSNARNTDVQRTGSTFRWACDSFSELKGWDPQLDLIDSGDNTDFVPDEFKLLFAEAKSRDGLAPSAVLHLRRTTTRAA